ncbi:OadG family protein [Saccharicrinis sp. FJH2]|uniref:OadG family protein n=1 Tax=Saccharicrinis sp. FJH65 TaxID=3344659 RepID=UPI0035F41E76
MIFLFSSQVWIITFLGYAIVFVALVTLVYVFLLVPKILNIQTRRRLKKSGKLHPEEVVSDNDLQLSGEVSAAIAMSLQLFFNDLREEESNVITIKKIERRYSPWSSKIYGLNNVNFPK